jgi:hypothetical protein
MKNFIRLLLVFVILAAVLAFIPARVYAQTQVIGDNSPVVFGQNYTLSSGQMIKDLIIFGGNAVIMSGSTVTGDILIFGGNLDVSGTVQGGITSFGGNVTINDTAVVNGTLNTVGGNHFVSPEAKIGGQISDPSQLPFRFPTTIFGPSTSINLGPGVTLIWAVFLSLMLAALAVVVALFLPTPTGNVAHTLTGEPIISGAVGLLTLVIAPAIFLVLAITIVLIPLALLFLLVFGVTVVFGWIAMGMSLGERLASLFRAQWAVPVSAGIGTLTLSMLTTLTASLTGAWFWTLCCIGVPIILLLNIISLGAVISSRYGIQRYSTRLRPQAPMPVPPMPSTPAPVAPAPLDLTPVPPEPPLVDLPPVSPEPPYTPPAPPEPPADSSDQKAP